MSKEEFEKAKEELQLKYDESLRGLIIRCATENNPYKVGDVVEDHLGKGVIKKIVCFRDFSGNPTCKYLCDNLTKRGTINKKEPERVIYQQNIKTKE